jgi:hypothetical protein
MLQEALNAGKGALKRDTESGALLMDLVRHADVMEYLLWINSWGEMVYKAVWGDKDTYAVAFAVAGKAQHFTQVQVSHRDICLQRFFPTCMMCAGLPCLLCTMACMFLCLQCLASAASILIHGAARCCRCLLVALSPGAPRCC